MLYFMVGIKKESIELKKEVVDDENLWEGS